MKKCKYKKVSTIIKHYGYDWSNLMLDDISFKGEDLRKIRLPDDPELFQKIKDKAINGAALPKDDYSRYNFDGVILAGCIFTPDSVFSLDKKVFQKIHNKSLAAVTLPKGDYSEYDFDDVHLNYSKFTSDSIFSNDKEVFQKISYKNLEYVALPKGDYSNYNFIGVNIEGCRFTRDSIFCEDKEVFQYISKKKLCSTLLPKGDYSSYNFKGVYEMSARFTRDSILPEYEDFLKDINPTYSCYFSDNVIRNIHNYNLDGVTLDLRFLDYRRILTQKQIDIIKVKYPNDIGNTIHLPDKVFGKDKDLNYDF